MKTKWAGVFLVWVMVVATPVLADSVYSWTDEDGVRHYSNTGIPPGVQQAEERPEENSSPPAIEPGQPSGEEGRGENTPGPESVDTPEEEAAAAGSEKKMDARLAARVERERQRLGAEIKRIQGLSIGKSFTPGMKDAMIKPLQEQLALLEADPERYFRMKREGAFNNGANTNPPSESGPLSDPLESFEPSSSSSTDQAVGEGTNSPQEGSGMSPSQ